MQNLSNVGSTLRFAQRGFFVSNGINMTKDLTKFIKKNWKLILALLYLLSPLDIIPDVLPFIGISDDALVAIITLVQRYIDFKKEQKMEDKFNNQNMQEGEIIE